MEIKKEELIISDFEHLYIIELYSLADAIKRDCEEVFNEVKIPSEKGYYAIESSAKIHSKINSIVINAANIKKLIYPQEFRKKKESAKVYNARIARAQIFKTILGDLDLEEIKKTNVRNRLEHFDEYLDKAISTFQDENSTIKHKHALVSYNTILSHMKAIDPPVYPLRLYVSTEKVFYHLETSINIGKLYEEAKGLLGILLELEDIREEMGGVLLKLYDF
ncbi:hypothetical protein [Bacillus velezensis]|uniref:hypothetical protein n=1 Tax=Bacillus velezensis TaxID=492670 RepID=UPI00090A0566|nr:hypothetical protein [Bacillus velezensis]APH36121.1 hypothetical protein BHE96_11250 [Bacillus subtilis]